MSGMCKVKPLNPQPSTLRCRSLGSCGTTFGLFSSPSLLVQGFALQRDGGPAATVFLKVCNAIKVQGLGIVARIQKNLELQYKNATVFSGHRPLALGKIP